jgi:dTDP-4-amino-4,6-dideoxygalactose transaminase/ubiquinone/menaquinone biosynthesis C-methylase UbiE
MSLLLKVVREAGYESLRIAELGCGSGELLDYIKKIKLTKIHYVGADRAGAELELARRKHPEATFIEVDTSDPGADLMDLAADYIIANKLFMPRHQLRRAEMQAAWADTLGKIWRVARRGVVLNLAAKEIDRKSDDLFHPSLDALGRRLQELAAGDIVIRVNPCLDGYIAYAYKENANTDGETPIASPLETDDVAADIPVLRPLVARRDRIAPYLDRIDSERIYSNYGPLVVELNERLSHSFCLPTGSVVCASSGTAALTGAILAEVGRASTKRPLAVVPSFTFVATALAVEQCGYELLLMDVDRETWMLCPHSVQRLPDLDRVGLVVPVAPFGRHVPQEPWLHLRRETGIPVIVDAAASFEAFMRQKTGTVGIVPAALSFHTTKAYSTGEGGAVVSLDADCVLRSARALNFGILGDRDCRGPGLNGKMSEYHAAVGLAELDWWSAKAMAFHRVMADYEREFRAVGLSDRLFRAPDVASCYMLFLCRTAAEAARVALGLSREGIGHRAWYGAGLQAQPHFLQWSREDFPVTKDLAHRLIGLPAGPTLSRMQIERVASTLARYVSSSADSEAL